MQQVHAASLSIASMEELIDSVPFIGRLLYMTPTQQTVIAKELAASGESTLMSYVYLGGDGARQVKRSLALNAFYDVPVRLHDDEAAVVCAAPDVELFYRRRSARLTWGRR